MLWPDRCVVSIAAPRTRSSAQGARCAKNFRTNSNATSLLAPQRKGCKPNLARLVSRVTRSIRALCRTNSRYAVRRSFNSPRSSSSSKIPIQPATVSPSCRAKRLALRSSSNTSSTPPTPLGRAHFQLQSNPLLSPPLRQAARHRPPQLRCEPQSR